MDDRLRGESTFGYGLSLIPEDLDREPIPRATVPTGARNGWPADKPYRYNPDGLARERAAARRLEVIRRKVLKIVTAEPMMFTDPISEQRCELVTVPAVGIRHPGCDDLADLCAEVDAFYCQACGMNGRINGAWALEMARNARKSAIVSNGNDVS